MLPFTPNFSTFTLMSTSDQFGKEIWEGFLRENPEAGSGAMSLEEINQRMAQYVARRNAAPQSDFEGLSPIQMRTLMYDPFESGSPLVWVADQNEEAIAQVPLLVLLDLLMADIQRTGEVKLTTKGNLPVALCTLLVEQGLIELKYWMSRGKPTEDKIPYLWPLKEFLMEEKLVKKRLKKLSLTKKGTEFMLLPASARLRIFITYFTARFHWGNLYHLEDDGHYGQMGVWYSLWLLLKYGDERREASFYLEKWRKVFDRASKPNYIAEYAYFIRFFDSFCRWFGLAHVEERNTPGEFDRVLLVEKSELLERVFDKTAS